MEQANSFLYALLTREIRFLVLNKRPRHGYCFNVVRNVKPILLKIERKKEEKKKSRYTYTVSFFELVIETNENNFKTITHEDNRPM